MIVFDINDLSEIDLASVPLSQLQHRGGTFHSTKRGERGRVGVQTTFGDILESVWREAVERVALRDYESWLVDALEEWSTKLAFISSRGEARKYALELYSSRIFDNKQWVDYTEFNRKYRPDVVKDEQFLTVMAECCKQPGEMTRERYEDGYATCPICGRAAEVTLINTEDKEQTNG